MNILDIRHGPSGITAELIDHFKAAIQDKFKAFRYTPFAMGWMQSETTFVIANADASEITNGPALAACFYLIENAGYWFNLHSDSFGDARRITFSKRLKHNEKTKCRIQYDGYTYLECAMKAVIRIYGFELKNEPSPIQTNPDQP